MRPITTTTHERIDSLIALNRDVRLCTESLLLQGRRFIFLSGDHSTAIGIWGGVMRALAKTDRQLGLIWIDAHMDAHTTASSPSGNPHGMPVAALLGVQDPVLERIRSGQPEITPEQIILVGIHSYESIEKRRLDSLGVEYYMMSRVRQLGLRTVLHRCWQKLLQHCDLVGISIDLDAVDPRDAPGVTVPVAHGLRLQEMLRALSLLPVPAALEISEYSPCADRNLKTMRAITAITRSVFNRTDSRRGFSGRVGSQAVGSTHQYHEPLPVPAVASGH
ncbi:MAG: arginase family protein [Candidatus Thiodiazotropha lotti]|nr:arginase family protein [Candidatus Thiodiazotropha lotti]MCG7981674.1 arginase family protein [Candidatus Thiodiazotropha lotti]